MAMIPSAARAVAGLLAGDGGAEDELRRVKARFDEAARLAGAAEALGVDRADVRAWLQELGDAAYELADVADDCRRRAAEQQRQRQARKSVLHFFSLLSDFNGSEYKTLKTSIYHLNQKMDGILKNGSQLGLQPINCQNLNGRSEFSGDPVPCDDNVGEIETEKVKLIEILTDRQSANVIVAIVGSGGIGKTTLARKIHDDHRTRNAFSTVLWVCVSKDLNDMELLSAIVTAAGGKPRGAERRMHLEAMLATILEGKRFLIVLDDVWSGQIYGNLLEAVLHGGAHGSRILITTRDGSVATEVNATYIHKVKKLSFQDCWSLLCSNALMDKDLDDNTLREIGIMIIQKCNNLPMAVKVIGGVLRRKEKTREEWQRVCQSEQWSFNDLPEDMRSLAGPIYLGYNDLPSHLKQCFLYCSLFPEGSVIKQQFVTRLWISEGLVEERDNCNPEDIAEEYYRELVLRNLLQPEVGTHDITRCTIHRIIRSFLQFFTEHKIFVGELECINESFTQGLRHLWIVMNRRMVTLEEIGSLTSLRTLILYKNPLGNRGLDKVFKGLKYLRALDLAGTNIRNIPRTLELLLHLRLLNLSLTRITELPESIEGLRNLEFLGLRYCNWLHSLPKGIGKLHKLRNLDLRGTALYHVLPRLVNLKQLSTLHGFIVNHKVEPEEDMSGWPLEDLKFLNALRSLQILKIERVSDCSRAQEANLATKSHLRELELCCRTDDRLANVLEEDARRLKDMFDCLSPPQCLKSLKIVSYYGKWCPNWLIHLPNLQRLVLTDCKFCESLPDLGQLPQLKFLIITGCSKLHMIEQEPANANQAFPKLQHLHLKDMQNLKSWTGFAPGGLPSLVKFRLETCPKLISLPSGLRYSAALTSMQIFHADSLEVVEDLPMLKELILQTSNKLMKVSKLPLLEVLVVLDCPRLQDVNEVHSLSHIRIVDRELTKLPDWLRSHAPVLQTLTIVATAELLKKLVPNGEDWAAIRDVEKVYANMPDESPFFTYTKSFADFHVNQRIGEIGDPSVVPAAVIANEVLSSISLENSLERSAQIGLPNMPVNRMMTLARMRRIIRVRQYFGPYIIMVLLGTLSLPYVLQNKTIREIGLIQTLVIFLATIFLLPFLFLD